MSEDNKKSNKIVFDSLQAKQDEYNEALLKNSGVNLNTELMKSIVRNAAGSAFKPKGVPRLAFAQDPNTYDNYAGVYKLKRGLIPDQVIKQIRIQNFLVAAILRTRGNMVSMMGHVRKNRFDVGIDIEIKPEFKDHIEPEQMVKVRERMDRFLKILINCGHVDGLQEVEKMTLPEFLDIQTRNGLSFGRFATEIIFEKDENGESTDKFHRFRPVDAGTIYRTVKKGEGAEQVRRSSIQALRQLTGTNIDVSMAEKDEYAWIQAISQTPKQAFTDKEMVVYNLFPSSDVEHAGYPVTPMDTIMTSLTTHYSIEIYNNLYFQNGRAARGMLVINSDEIDQSTIEDIKQQFNASINNVNNSFRTPIFGIKKDDMVNWVSTQPQRKDGEFQFLFEQVTRNIMSAFNMSPDELPGFTHLSKGTNQQSLCLDLSSLVVTDKGQMSLADILERGERVYTKIWTGTDFKDAVVFRSGVKDLVETNLTGGLSIKTSPDHRFRSIDENGELVWKHQHELKKGDYVLTSKKTIESNIELPKINGKEITPELMEVLGWITGDGSIVGPVKRAGGYVTMFYNHDKESDIRDRHFKYLTDFGLKPTKKDIHFSEDEVEKTKERYGFKSVSKIRIKNVLYDTDFIKQLLELGFKTSKEGKEIPGFINVLPEKFKASFLKGLFSADGHVCKDVSGAVILTMESNKLKDKTRLLLLSMGIRVNNFTGSTKEMIVGNKREVVPACNKLLIKDKRAFYEKIGFHQDHKQPKDEWLAGEDKNKIPMAIQKQYCEKLIKSELSRDYKKDLYAFVSDDPKKRMTLQRLQNLCSKVDILLPNWVYDYNIEEVIETVEYNTQVPMGDIEIFDSSHQFVANGIIVHNSESNNEYKLTAARDGGIRPLLLKMQDFLNEKLFPIIDKELSQLCNIQIAGFDAETKQQESIRLQQDMPVHYTYDDVLEEVDKEQVGSYMAGFIPFNERYRQAIDTYLEVNKISEFFLESPASIVDPMLKYKRDPFFFQNLEVMANANPYAYQAYFATRPDAIKILKMYLKDFLDEDEG